MVTTDAAIEALLMEEGGYFDAAPASPKRAKRKSGAHKPVQSPYIKSRDLGYMTGKGQLASSSYKALIEILGTDSRARPQHNTDEGVIECVNRDFGVVFAAVDCRGAYASIYPNYCLGNTTEFKYMQMLSDKGFDCAAWDIRMKEDESVKRLKLVECSPAERTATVYFFNFADQDKAKLWVASLTGLGYQVKTQGF